jgi:hypothetical protein
MSHDHDHLSPDIQALVDEARALPRVAASSRVAVRQRLAASLLVPLAAPPSPAPASAPASVAARRWPFTLATFVVGALSGAAAHRALAPPPAPVTVVRVVHAPPPAVAPPVAATPSVATPSVAPVVEAPAVVAPMLAADVPAHPRVGAREPDEASLSSERAVLELARTGLTRGQSSAAIDALERHARRFPRGRLAPERESMWVQALVSAGRYDSAREHAARFRRAYPGSMFQSVVDAALREIP